LLGVRGATGTSKLRKRAVYGGDSALKNIDSEDTILRVCQSIIARQGEFWIRSGRAEAMDDQGSAEKSVDLRR